MTAQPIHEAFPGDLAEILRILPPRWHAQFLDEYRAALEAAREVQRWPPHLPVLLHLWSLRAAAYADPQYGLSGVTAKRLASSYRPGPSRDWVTIGGIRR